VTVANSFSAILFQPLFATDGALSKQKATVRALLVLALVCGVPAAVVFSNSRMVVGLIFGRNWLEAAPIVGWLSLNGFVRAIGMVPGSFLSVSGRNRELLMTSVVSAAGSLALVVALASSSIAACAISLVVKNAAIVGWMAWLSRGEVRQPAATYAASVIIPIVVMIAAASSVTAMLPAVLAVDLLHELIRLGLSGAGALCCGGAWIGVAYTLSVRSSDRQPTVELRA
jgi:O-antigen/teichoic acid export membrane protein